MIPPLDTDSADRDPFEREAYGPVFAGLIGAEPAMPLDAGRPNAAMRGRLAGVTVEEAFAGQTIADRGSADCCLAAVWLLHGFLDEAHTLCQDVPSASGSYWHGVMHRREGDYGNAQYWFRRAGDHPIGPVVVAAAVRSPLTAETALGGRWKPVGFVDLVRRAASRGGPLVDACVALQRAEWRALFDECWRSAVS